jgi:hypothetical protein
LIIREVRNEKDMTTPITKEIFNFAIGLCDNSIEHYDLSWLPSSGSDPRSLNLGGYAITFDIHANTRFLMPCNAYLDIEGQLLKAVDSSVYAQADRIAFQNNGVMAMFSNVTLQIDDKNVEQYAFVNQAVNMHKLLTSPPNLSQMSQKDEVDSLVVPTAANIDTDGGFKKRHNYVLDPDQADDKQLGKFALSIPLKDVFGFVDDYKKVIFNKSMKFVFTRASNDNNALLRTSGSAPATNDTTDGKIEITNMRIRMPVIKPTSVCKLEKMTNVVPFRRRDCIEFSLNDGAKSWSGYIQSNEVPLWVIVGFQTGRDNSQTVNSGYFDNLQVRDVEVRPNGQITLDQNRHSSRLYTDAMNFANKFYARELPLPYTLTPDEWKKSYNLFVFDMRFQKDKSYYSNFIINFNFNVGCGNNTFAFVMLHYDSQMTLV